MHYTEKGQLFTETVLEVFKLSGLLATEGDRLTKALGLSSARWKVLGAIKLSDSPLTVAQAAREMGLTRQAVQRLADAMVKDGLLVYENNPHHKRARYVVLTDQGKQIYAQVSDIQIPWANQTSRDIELTELEATLSGLQKMRQLFD